SGARDDRKHAAYSGRERQGFACRARHKKVLVGKRSRLRLLARGDDSYAGGRREIFSTRPSLLSDGSIAMAGGRDSAEPHHPRESVLVGHVPTDRDWLYPSAKK